MFVVFVNAANEYLTSAGTTPHAKRALHFATPDHARQEIDCAGLVCDERIAVPCSAYIVRVGGAL